MTNRLNFFFTEAMRSLTTNVATSAAATLTMLFSLMMFGSLLWALTWALDESERVESQAAVVEIFLQDTVSEDDVEALRSQLDNMTEVKKVTYVSKEDALDRAKELFKDNPELLEELAGNPFPASLRAELVDNDQAKTVTSRIENEPGVFEARYKGEKAKDVLRGIKQFQTIAGFVIAIFIVVSTVLVANTIRLSIFARRREIEVMKLVGASNSFVRLPFIIEGFLCGLGGALGAILFLLLVKEMLVGRLIDNAHLDPSILGIMLLMGIVLGGVGSGITLRRFLRV